MNVNKVATTEEADDKAMSLGAVRVIDYRPDNSEALSIHYFLQDDTEIAMYHPTLESFMEFCPPRVWSDESYHIGTRRTLQRGVEVATLEGDALDYAVGLALGWRVYFEDSKEQGDTWHCDPERSPFGKIRKRSEFKPSTCYSQGMPIIEENHIEWRWLPHDRWGKQVGARRPSFYGPERTFCMVGPTILVAAMRCFVATKLGDFVLIPKGVMNYEISDC